MSFYEEKSALSREKRSGAISHYHGTLASLIADAAGDEIPQRIRTFTQATYDDILSALIALRGIRDAAIVVHGAAGCAAAACALAQAGGARWYSVNLSERDSILGSEAPLREAILRAIAEGAAAVFVVGTPVVAINNDDVNAVLLALEKETAVPVLHVNTDGFRSKSPLSGFDAALHALLRLVDAPGECGERDEYGERGERDERDDSAREAPDGSHPFEPDLSKLLFLPHETPLDEIKPDGAAQNFVNLLAVRDNVRNIAAIASIVDALGINWNLLPGLSSLENIRRAGQARATVSLNSDESEYLGLGLEAAFGTPYLRLPAPVGRAATRRLVAGLAEAFGLGDKADVWLRAQEAALQDVLSARPLAGKKIFLQMDMALVEGFSELIRDLGGELAGVALSSVDLNNRKHLARLEAAADIPALVAVGQPFEVANVLAKTPVDYYIGPEQVAFAARFGVKPISLRGAVYYGYEGMRAFAARIGGPHPDFRERVRGEYTESWLKKNGGWHVKREVR
ncbi:MAG: nitrogenase component 1 [Azoarcus sp.]|jgi:nitrogenase molybdenum-iron protein alpha chain|nr:nitrogenase component 1 [Azoarcus sp.]